MGTEPGQVMEAFLVHKSGCLLAYKVAEPTASADYDIVVGMLTALQSFVHDAFGAGRHSLKSLEFEDKNIHIEVRGDFYLAVVLNARPTALVRKNISSVLNELETRYGRIASTWNGDMGEWIGASDILDGLFYRAPPQRQASLCPLCGTVPVAPGATCEVCGYLEDSRRQRDT